jgi:hypothetical protein
MTTNIKLAVGIGILGLVFNALVAGYCTSTSICGADAFGISFFINVTLGITMLATIATSVLFGGG